MHEWVSHPNPPTPHPHALGWMRGGRAVKTSNVESFGRSSSLAIKIVSFASFGFLRTCVYNSYSSRPRWVGKRGRGEGKMLSILLLRCFLLGSLSCDVFKRRTSILSGLATLLSRDFEEMFEQIVSIRAKKVSHTN